jgi:hypothetical protein
VRPKGGPTTGGPGGRLHKESRRYAGQVRDAIDPNEIVGLAADRQCAICRCTCRNTRTNVESRGRRWELVEQLAVAGKSAGWIAFVTRESTCRADSVCGREGGIQRDAVAVADDEDATVGECDFDPAALLGNEGFAFAEDVA